MQASIHGGMTPEADTLLLTVPNTLGIDCNVHEIESIVTHVAPALVAVKD